MKNLVKFGRGGIPQKGRLAINRSLLTLPQDTFSILLLRISVKFGRGGIPQKGRLAINRSLLTLPQDTFSILLLRISVKFGRGGIRTPGPFRAFCFQDRCNRPLCHSSKERNKL